MGRLDDCRYYACYFSDWPEGIVRRKRDDGFREVLYHCEGDFGPPALALVIPEEEAKKLILWAIYSFIRKCSVTLNAK